MEKPHALHLLRIHAILDALEPLIEDSRPQHNGDEGFVSTIQFYSKGGGTFYVDGEIIWWYTPREGEVKMMAILEIVKRMGWSWTTAYGTIANEAWNKERDAT